MHEFPLPEIFDLIVVPTLNMAALLKKRALAEFSQVIQVKKEKENAISRKYCFYLNSGSIDLGKMYLF